MRKFRVLVEVIVEADDETQASHKISEALKVFESFAISEGPDEVGEEQPEPEDE